MRLAWIAAVAAVVVACSSRSATGLKPPPPDTTKTDTSKLKDPTVDLYNNSPNRVYFTWASGQAVLGADTIPPLTHRCEAFTAVADSAFWEVLDSSGTAQGEWADQRTAYFDPTARPAWNVAVSEQPGGIIIIAKDTTAECVP